VARILSSALAGVDPSSLIKEKATRKGSLLDLMGEQIDLASFPNIYLLGIGKAARPMTLTMADLLEDYLQQGYILTKGETDPLPASFQDRVKIFSGSHPIPGNDSLLATTEILEGLGGLAQEDLVITLISGGGSALFTQPAGKITLKNLQTTHQTLLDCGADIREINTIRKHLSAIKGGQLAQHLHPARILTLILSDVIGDPIDMIASGPTSPDPSTYQDAMGVIAKYSLEDQLPEVVIRHLIRGQNGEIPETPKPGDPLFSRTKALILAGNRDALQAGAAQAEQEGFQITILTETLAGEAKKVGETLALKLKEITPNDSSHPGPTCLIAGGETTVTLSNIDEPGKGGRNLELALGALPILAGMDRCLLVTLATDGEDGSSGAAGAVVSGDSLQRCQQMGLKPKIYLERHDSHAFFNKLNDLIQIGPTGTNVNDLCFMFIL
jgi:hydroxypyruvate reductase